MTLTIFRLFTIGNMRFKQDDPYISYTGLVSIEIKDGYLYADMYGEQLTIFLDYSNYYYQIESK